MKKSFWDKRIPTLLGILAITLGTFLTSTLVGRQTNFIGQAAPTNIPREVRITNIGSTSFTVSYITETEVTGTISFGKDQNFGLIALDEGGNLSSRVHSIKVNNLSPSTRYFFSILSGGETFLNNNLPYEVTTGPTLTQEKPSGGFIVGKILNISGKVIKQGLVYATVGESQTYSAVLKSDGTYSISLEGLRTNDLSSYFDFKDTKIKMLAVAPEGKSNVSARYKEVTSIPPIVITKNYDFTEDSPVSTTSATLQNFPNFPTTQGGVTPKITTPQEDQELSEQRPTFRGTAIPRSKITVVIESEREEAEVTVDQNGNWTYRPTQTLTPGEHKITISARDAFGVLRTITHTFVILAEPGEAQASTPSASPSPSPSPSLSPAPSSTPTATPIAILPTPTLTPIPTILPEVGNLNVALAGINLVKTLFGGLLFIVSRGNISF